MLYWWVAFIYLRVILYTQIRKERKEMTKMTNTKNTITIKTMADLFKLFTVKGTAGVDGYELPEFWYESVYTTLTENSLLSEAYGSDDSIEEIYEMIGAYVIYNVELNTGVFSAMQHNSQLWERLETLGLVWSDAAYEDENEEIQGGWLFLQSWYGTSASMLKVDPFTISV